MRAIAVRSSLIALLAVAQPLADARTARSHSAKAEFQREHICPATGRHRGACQGYVIDHRVALCVGGPDNADNMRWMTVAAAKAKDRWECRHGWPGRLRRCEAEGCFVESN